METDAYIALGSNLGDRKLNLLTALAELGKLQHCRITGISSFYKTAAIGMAEDAPAFYNAVARLATTLISATELLHKLQQIEHEKFARKPSTTVKSRTMDLDLLLFGEQIMETGQLTLPHPRMKMRKFVLVPLLEIAPKLVDPASGKKFNEILQTLPPEQQIQILE